MQGFSKSCICMEGKRVKLAAWQVTRIIKGNQGLISRAREGMGDPQRSVEYVSNSSFCPQMLRLDDFALHFQHCSCLLFHTSIDP